MSKPKGPLLITIKGGQGTGKTFFADKIRQMAKAHAIAVTIKEIQTDSNGIPFWKTG